MSPPFPFSPMPDPHKTQKQPPSTRYTSHNTYVGLARAKELMFRARRFGPAEALRLGVVHSAHDAAEALEAELAAVCGDIAANVRAHTRACVKGACGRTMCEKSRAPAPTLRVRVHIRATGPRGGADGQEGDAGGDAGGPPHGPRGRAALLRAGECCCGWGDRRVCGYVWVWIRKYHQRRYRLTD